MAMMLVLVMKLLPKNNNKNKREKNSLFLASVLIDTLKFFD